MRWLVALVALVGLVGCDEPSPTTPDPGRAKPAIREAPDWESSQPRRREVQGSPEQDSPTQREPEPSQASEGDPLARREESREARGSRLDRGGVRGALIEAPAPLLLETSFEPTQGKWVARWTLTNQGPDALYVAAQLPTQRRGRNVPSRQRLYVRAHEGTLHLTKRLWRIPRSVAPFVRELPYLERLDPGQSLSGAVRIPPLVAKNYPYQAGPGQEAQLVREVVISFGFFGQEAEPQAVEGAASLYQVPYEAIGQQRFVESPAYPARLSVR